MTSKINNLFVILLSVLSLTIHAQISKQDESDVSIFPAKPYQLEGAGCKNINVDHLKKYTFKQTDTNDDSPALNKLIEKVHKEGGGVIQIPSGNYHVLQIILQSNIHLRIAQNTVFNFPENSTKTKGEISLFMLGKTALTKIENITIIGEGTPQNRPKMVLKQEDIKHRRVFSFGNAENVLIENLSIEDEMTRGSAIAFNLPYDGNSNAHRPKNVTIANISMTGAAQGYGLVQTNVGENLLLKNLVCTGGMCCRIESHTGRKEDVGLDNIVIKNVKSIHGKAAVLLQPHSVKNGRVLVDGATAIGSNWAVFIREGFVAAESKSKTKGVFIGSEMKNIAIEYSNTEAVTSEKDIVFFPENLKALIGKKIEKDEKAFYCPSVCAIFTDANTYSVKLPDPKDIIVGGEDVHLRPQKIIVYKQ